MSLKTITHQPIRSCDKGKLTLCLTTFPEIFHEFKRRIHVNRYNLNIIWNICYWFRVNRILMLILVVPRVGGLLTCSTENPRAAENTSLTKLSLRWSWPVNFRESGLCRISNSPEQSPVISNTYLAIHKYSRDGRIGKRIGF